MARSSTGPEPQLAALRAKRLQHAIERDEMAASMRKMEAELAQIPTRRREALVREARGLGGEPHEQVVADEVRLTADVSRQREQIQALSQVERELGAELLAVVDAHADHFVAKAEAASEAAEAAEVAAEEALTEARELRRASEDRWLVCYESARRREESLPPHPPSPSLPNLDALKQIGSMPWPGGSRDAWVEWRAYEAGDKAKLSNREAIAQFGGSQ